MKNRLLVFALLCFAFSGCRTYENCKSKDGPWSFRVPERPSYEDATQWYSHNQNAQVDIFYIASTETGDYKRGRHTYHNADTYADSLRLPILGEMQGVDVLLSGNLNYYSPYYRQCSLQTYTKDKFVTKRMPVAIQDVKDAFRYYITHINQGRPFILAGFSQGAMIVHLDVESSLLFVEGYKATDYVLPLIGREGNYHSREIWLYRDALRNNMALRAAEFLKKRGND